MPPRKAKEAAGSPKKAKATKAKKEKDPNAPKKPSGAYIFFCGDKRAEVKKANPEYGVAQIGKELGAMWKDVTEADKQVRPVRGNTAFGYIVFSEVLLVCKPLGTTFRY